MADLMSDYPKRKKAFLPENAWMSDMSIPPPDPLAGPRPEMREADRYSPVRSLGERAGNALLDYGPIPAKIATGIAMQPVRAGEAIAEAAYEPNIPNITNAGVQTAMSVLQPAKAIGILGGGYLAALAKEHGLIGGASAADGLSDSQEARLKDLQRKVDKGAWKSGTERKLAVDEIKGLLDIQAEAAKRENEASARVKEKKDAASQDEWNRAVASSERALSEGLSKDRKFKDSEVGKVYEKTGGYAPFLMGVGGGMVQRMAAGKGAGGLKDYAIPAAEGSALTFAGLNAPFVYDATSTETRNPRKTAYEDAARELPDGHPRKAMMEKYAGGLPESNPVKADAWKELTDPMGLVRRGVTAIAEGAPAGLLGAAAPSALWNTLAAARGLVGNSVRDVGRMPGLVQEGAALQGGALADARRLMQEKAAMSIPPPKELPRAETPASLPQIAPPKPQSSDPISPNVPNTVAAMRAHGYDDDAIKALLAELQGLQATVGKMK